MNNILAQLNSVPMYAICGGIIAFVAVVCVIFLGTLLPQRVLPSHRPRAHEACHHVERHVFGPADVVSAQASSP